MKLFAVVLGLGLSSAICAAQGVNCNMQGYKAVDGVRAVASSGRGDAELAGRGAAGVARGVCAARWAARGGGAGGAQGGRAGAGWCWAKT